MESREERGPPCARGRTRERGAWLAGLGEAPASAAPAVVDEEEEGVLETGPLDTTTQRNTHWWINGLLGRCSSKMR